MKLPALRAKIGDWTYYTSILSFEEISKYVEKVDGQLHKSQGLKDLIQRSLTKNYESIGDYILNQKERFFNAIVLAIYDGIPNWIEVETKFGEEEYFNLGFLDFPGNQKIFPIDGQHRVEGIKKAVLVNPELRKEKITVIFVGHSNTDSGMQRSRRLFSTLNRYAKPVTMDDIIALDEDDSVAIITRNLLETFDLFSKDHVTKSKNKSIQENDKKSITSIITLYQCNTELLKLFRKIRKEERPNAERDKKSLDEYLKFRPKEEEINKFEEYCVNYWMNFKENLDVIKEYLLLIENNNEQPALKFRNQNDGGNLLFRPVGLLPFVQATIEIKKRTRESFKTIFENYNKVNMSINTIPWLQVLWNPFEKTMIMGNQGLVKLLFIYFYKNVIKRTELESLKNKYADRISYQGDNLNEVLNSIPKIKL